MIVVEIWECKLGLDAIVDLVQLTQLSFNFSPLSTRVPKTLAPVNMRKAVIFNILNIFKCIEGELVAHDITRKKWNYLDIMTYFVKQNLQRAWLDKAPRPSISNVIWILSSDTLFVSSTNSIQIVRRQCCLSQWFGGKFGCLQCCSSFRGSSLIWGASAWSAAKMASQLPNLHSIPKNDPWNSILIYQTRIFCKKNGPKSSILPEIEVQTFYYPLYAVVTACCVPWQIPVRNMKEHSREIC